MGKVPIVFKEKIMELYAEEVLVIVSDNKIEDSTEIYFAQCFWVEAKDLSSFLKICCENNKYVKIELDYTEEEN
jgi:hypothetical protein